MNSEPLHAAERGIDLFRNTGRPAGSDLIGSGEGRVLSSMQIEQWQRDGFLIVRNVFQSSEMAALSDEAWQLTQQQHLIERNNLRCRFRETFDETATLWETFDPVIDLSPECAKFSADSRLVNLLQQLYGEPACLFKDKLIFKQPGTRGYELHQDWIAWRGFPRSFLTVLIPIDPSTTENGCTEVFPGYHRQGCLTPEDGQYHRLPDSAVDESLCVPLELQPGDIAVFDGFAPHRSAANQSSSWRRQLYLSYNAQSDGGHQRDAHYREFHEYLRRRSSAHDSSAVYFR
ncbi:MAG: phytanoyl-CoA dioxygenase family protein [Planctomycetaceae bacterium]